MKQGTADFLVKALLVLGIAAILWYCNTQRASPRAPSSWSEDYDTLGTDNEW